MSDQPPRIVSTGAIVQISWPEGSYWGQGGYCNIFSVNHTPWDITMQFGYVAVPPQNPDMPSGTVVNAVATPVAQITMAPGALKQFVQVLGEQLAMFEAEISGNTDPGLQPGGSAPDDR